MAKKVNPDPVVTEQAGENAVKAAEADVVAIQPEASPEVKKVAEFPVPSAADEQVMQILKVYPNYESLYVDRHGSAYVPDTPAILRKEAVLYKNPFYKTSKTKE